ncbi:MAG: DNA recombination protein RmuC [Acidimicrobiales bacterium]
MVALAAVLGVVFGALVAGVVMARRSAALAQRESDARRDVAVRDAQLGETRETLERERAERAEAMRGLESTFKSLSQEVLDETVARFRVNQEDVTKERDAKLDGTLAPLRDALAEYQRSLADFSVKHTGALSDVKSNAEKLLEAQGRVQEATQRLNQILGRADQRGHWGEIQLANVLEASHLRRDIDYRLQVTAMTDDGKRQRPDCEVNLPNGHRVAIDAKFPFDAFEAAMRADDPEERASLYVEHADALRKHVKALKDRAYWELVAPAPEFVVCFVPSDFAITAAFDADPDLLRDAARDHVLISGPTNLLSLLWSVAAMLQQHQALVNTEEILRQSQEIVTRIRTVAEPVMKMGRSLDDSVKQYNKMVSSFESRLIVSARRIRQLGGARGSSDLPELGPVDSTPSALADERWGVDAGVPLVEGGDDIPELEAEEG